MSGHSKWATIKHKKAVLDAKRGKIFTKIIKEITVAARRGGDILGNPRLRFLVEKAKASNMPHENITRAIKKGTGELPGQQYESHTYEGYGPYNVAVIVEVLTDNKNKAVAELRHFFSREHCSLGANGSVSWMFERACVIRIERIQIDEEDLLEILINHSLKSLDIEDNDFIIVGDSNACDVIKQELVNAGITIKEAELEWVPKTTLKLAGEEEERVLEFLQNLEELDDVQDVYANLS